MKKIFNLPKTIAAALIDFYQLTLSPDHSWLSARYPHGFCRYYPSCSQYAKEAVERFGAAKGFWLASKRLIKCHPFAEPKIDPVPKI